MLKVCKFGGTSLADAEQFQKAASIIKSDESRKVIVVSAAGKRHAHDQKITDLLYLSHAHFMAGKPCYSIFEEVRNRYSEIEKRLYLDCNIDMICSAVYANLGKNTSLAYLVSRGEYLSAKLLSAYLGYTFIDSARWLYFNPRGHVDEKKSRKALRSLYFGQNIVIPGFYGVDPSGQIRLFTRGGSDITGALAAKYLQADEYENWTDVNGILCADPRVVENPKTVLNISYRDLSLLSKADLQVIHASAIAPVKESGVLLSIRNTDDPCGVFTKVSRHKTDYRSTPVLFASKKKGEKQSVLVVMCKNRKYKKIIIKSFADFDAKIVKKGSCQKTLMLQMETENIEKAQKTAYHEIYQKGSP